MRRRVINVPFGVSLSEWLAGRSPSYMKVEISAEQKAQLWKLAEGIAHTVIKTGQSSPLNSRSSVTGPHPFLAVYNVLQVVVMVLTDLLGNKEVGDFEIRVAMSVGEMLSAKLASQKDEGRHDN